MTRSSASREKWLQEGLEVLAKSGEAALTIELLVARLGVSRASFSWHFGDMAAFHAALVERWAENASVAREGARVFAADPRVDRAMRAWGVRDPAVAAQVEAVDRARMARLTEIHRAAGSPEPERVAALEYAAFVGASWLFEDLESGPARALAADLERALSKL